MSSASRAGALRPRDGGHILRHKTAIGDRITADAGGSKDSEGSVVGLCPGAEKSDSPAQDRCRWRRADGTRFSRSPAPRRVPYVEYDEIQAVCADCGRQFPSPESLERHRAEAHAQPEPPHKHPRRRRCSACGKEFYTLGALAAHNRRDHSG